MTLEQKTFFSGTTTFLLGEKELKIHFKKGGTRSQTSIPLDQLIKTPDQRASSKPKYIVGTLVILLVALMFFALGKVPSNEPDITGFNLIAIVFVIGSLVPLRSFFVSRYDSCLFFYRAGAVAFVVDRVTPDEATVERFVTSISQQVTDLVGQSVAGNQGSGIASEVERLGRLVERGLMSQDEFARAKESILSQLDRSGRTMGFH